MRFPSIGTSARLAARKRRRSDPRVRRQRELHRHTRGQRRLAERLGERDCDHRQRAPVRYAGPDQSIIARGRDRFVPSFSDAGVGDAPWTYTVHWGDGSAPAS